MEVQGVTITYIHSHSIFIFKLKSSLDSIPTSQGWSHNSLSGQVEFVPSLSDLHFRIGAVKIFSYGYLEIQITCMLSMLKLEGVPP